MTQYQQKELIKQYAIISEKLDNDEYTDKQLDELLTIFTNMLTENDSISYRHKRDLIQTMEELNYINENKEYINESITENTENADNEIEVKTLEKIYKLWKMKDNLTDKELEKNVSELMEYIEQFLEIEFSDEAMEQFDNDFKEFIQKIYLLSIDIKQAEKRLNSYFNIDKTIKENNPRPIDNEFNTYYEANLLLAMKNEDIATQSDLNRIKSLGMGNLLSESIKSVIPKRKHKQIKRLHNIQEKRYMEYLQTQSRLI